MDASRRQSPAELLARLVDLDTFMEHMRIEADGIVEKLSHLVPEGETRYFRVPTSSGDYLVWLQDDPGDWLWEVEPLCNAEALEWPPA